MGHQVESTPKTADAALATRIVHDSSKAAPLKMLVSPNRITDAVEKKESASKIGEPAKNVADKVTTL
jgi:hypothetical protein